MEQRLTRAAALFEGWRQPMILAVLEGAFGRVITASARPRAALLDAGDFLFLAGAPDEPETEALLKGWRDGHRDFRLLVPCTSGCGRLIETVFGADTPKATRYSFRQSDEHFDRAALKRMADAVPQGVSIAPVGRELYEKALGDQWSRDWCSCFRDAEDYLRRGLGFSALYQGELIAGASSYMACSGGIEIQVDTRSDWRRRGIAAACSARLILECLQRGLHPGWDAASPASAALAQKLGYLPAGEYTAWLLNTHR